MITHQLDKTLSALSNPTRRLILENLMTGEKTVGELSEPLSISPPAISRHLKVLEETNLVTYEKRTQYRIYSLNREGFDATLDYFEQYRRYWNQQFDALSEQLKKRGLNGD